MIEMDNSAPTPESLAAELKKHLICDDDYYIRQLCDAGSLNRIVRDVNATELPAEEVLSENVYFYDAANHKLRIIS